MAAGYVPPIPKWQVLLDDGTPNASGTLEFYDAGTSNARDTFSDADLTSANANPLTLDASGRATVFFKPGAYKIVAKDSSGSTLWTVDDVHGSHAPVTVLSKSVDYQVLDTDGSDILILVDASSAQRTITLLAVATASGRRVTVKKTDSSANTVVVDGASADQLDGATTQTLETQYDAITVVSDGTDWHIETFAELATAVSDNGVAGGRLTLESGEPVPDSDQSAKTTIYYTPWCSDKIVLYTGSVWVIYEFSELSATVSSLGMNNSSRPYDIFLDYNGGSPALAATPWTNDTTRATALVRQDGVWCLTGDLQQRYLGTVWLDGSDQFNDSEAQRHVWNMNNRVARPMQVLEATDTWNYTLAAYHQANAAPANQLNFIVGLNEQFVEAQVNAAAQNSSNGVRVRVAIGLDSTSAVAANSTTGLAEISAASDVVELHASYRGFTGIGRHALVWLEYSDATGTTAWFGDNGAAIQQQGILGWIWG